MRTVKFLILLLSIVGVTHVIAAAQTATMSVDSKLYTSSNMQSAVVANLAQGSKVTIQQRKGAWYEIKDEAGKTGWVRSYDVQLKSSGNWFSRLKRVIAGSSAQQSNSSATIGIRGLGPGDVKKAKPNLKELEKLDTFKQSLNSGKQYAASVPLKSNQVAYLSNNQTASSSSSTTNNAKPKEEKKKDSNPLDDVGNALKGLF